MMLSAPLAALALATTCFMSSGARNWPFLMLTGLPARATASMKSVCRHRNAGVCSTSTTAATAAISSSACTSVSTGTPIWRFTSARMRSPSSMPRPRNDVPELRLALSYDDLKMNGMPSAPQSSFSRPATSSCSCRDSTTQGPAIRNNGRSRPTSKPQSFMPCRRARKRRSGGRGLHRDAPSDRRDELGDRVGGAMTRARRCCSCAARTKAMNSGWPRARVAT